MKPRFRKIAVIAGAAALAGGAGIGVAAQGDSSAAGERRTRRAKRPIVDCSASWRGRSLCPAAATRVCVALA